MPNALAVRDGARALIEEISEDLVLALPANIPLDRFKATFLTAVSHNPEILDCEPTSIKTALMKCAVDNLVPDNREAALVPYKTKVKINDTEVYAKLCQYMPMIQGIRKRALELGGVRVIISECVYENDHFDAVLGDDPRIEHRAPPLGTPRGEFLGAYAIFKDESGNILHREIMDRAAIEAARKVSRAKDGPGWTNFYGEFARKTVVRRGSKSVPNMPDKLRQIIDRDDEYADFEHVAPRPRIVDHNPLTDPGRQIEGTRSDKGRPAETQQAAPARDVAPRPRDDAGGEADASSTRQSYRLSAEEFRAYHSALARMNTAENVTKADAQHWKANRPPVHPEDQKLCTDLFTNHRDRAEGKVPAELIAREVEGWITSVVGGAK